MKLGADTVLKTKGGDQKEAIDINCTIRHPKRDLTKKRSQYIKQVEMKKSGIAALTRSILRVSILNLICTCKKTESLPRVFFKDRRVIVSITSLELQKKRGGRLSVCWLVHDKTYSWPIVTHTGKNSESTDVPANDSSSRRPSRPSSFMCACSSH